MTFHLYGKDIRCFFNDVHGDGLAQDLHLFPFSTLRIIAYPFTVLMLKEQNGGVLYILILIICR